MKSAVRVLSAAGLSCFMAGSAWADLNDGLVAYYPFDGNAQDASGNGNHGNENGGVSYTGGVVGQSAIFDGIDDYISIPNSPSINITGQLTLAAWVKPINYETTGSEYKTIIWGKASYYLSLHRATSSLANYRYGMNNPGYHIVSPNSVPTGQYTHIAAVWDGNTLKQFINGLLVNTVANVSGVAAETTGVVRIGREDCCGNRAFNGNIDEARIYRRALSKCEIQMLYTGKDECNPMLVTLTNFTATPSDEDIRLDWETASEEENAGFHIWRAVGEGWKQADYSQVTRLTDQLISSQGGTLVDGAFYRHTDDDVDSGISYYYGLEDIDFNGQATFHSDFIDNATAK